MGNLLSRRTPTAPQQLIQQDVVEVTNYMSSLSLEGPRLEDRLNSMDSTDKRLKTIKKGLKILVGNGNTINNIVEATDYLFKRDFPEIYELNESSEKVQTFVPNYFLTKATKCLRPEKGDGILKELDECAKNNPSKAEDFKARGKKVQSALRVYRGDRPEMDLFNDLKEFYAERDETVTVFHGHQLYDVDITSSEKRSCNIAEKDFIIVNLTCRYIMVIEVKNTYGAGESAEKAEKQLMNAMESIKAWFGADIDASWLFVPVVYCNDVVGNKTPKNAYLVKGTEIILIFCKSAL